MVLHTVSFPLRLLRHSSSLSFSDAAAATADYLAPVILMLACYHYRIPTRTPGVLSNPSHRSSPDHVAMYCATLFCHL